MTLATNTPPKVSSRCNRHETMTPTSINPRLEPEERLGFETRPEDGSESDCAVDAAA
jgi:hypothetical protein